MAEQKEIENAQTVIVVPIYKSELDDLEMKSLERTYTILKNYPIVVICPCKYDIQLLQSQFPLLHFMHFADHYFESVGGYNQLMISSSFYKRFVDLGVEYILVCQLDAYVFFDNLQYFVDKAYDYIGAPYLERRLYTFFPFLKKIKSSKKKYRKKDIDWQQNDNEQAGNGGFSLRKVKSCYNTCLQYPERIVVYNTHQGISSVYNEDVFWSKEPSSFRYPSLEDALSFAFDKYPKLCFKKNNNHLPMACHGWYKWKWRSFWKQHIDF